METSRQTGPSLSIVAVGPTVADRPPIQIRTGALTHTALALDGGGQIPQPHIAQSLAHSFPALCRARVGQTMFSLARALPSPTSARVHSPLFGWFTGTPAQSDLSETYASALWL